MKEFDIGYTDLKKIVISMHQIEGDRDFEVYGNPFDLYVSMLIWLSPQLKTAPVFGGIAGIMSSERGELDEPNHIPAMSRNTREKSRHQDMYRRMLAASYDAQVGELPADKTVEDIFAGGDGWGKGNEAGKNLVDDDRSSTRTFMPKSPGRQRGHTRNKSANMGSSRSGTPSHEMTTEQEERSVRHHDEIDEFELREDLKNWVIRPPS